MRLPILALLSITTFAAETTADEREAVLKIDLAIKDSSAASSAASLQMAQAEVQYMQFMDKQRQEQEKLQAARAAAVAPLKDKCYAAKLGFDDKTLNCRAAK